jgi:hypothetical protein
MATNPGKRKAEVDLWEQYRPTLHRLYIEENQTLSELQHSMAAEYDFVKTLVLIMIHPSNTQTECLSQTESTRTWHQKAGPQEE